MKKRITWTQNTGLGRSGWTGVVGTRRLFSIEMSVSRRGKWVMRTRLPFQLADNKDLHENSDELKMLAERVLLTFLRSIGASFDD